MDKMYTIYDKEAPLFVEFTRFTYRWSKNPQVFNDLEEAKKRLATCEIDTAVILELTAVEVEIEAPLVVESTPLGIDFSDDGWAKGRLKECPDFIIDLSKVKED